LQQEIAEALDDAARKYYDETPKEERSDTEVTAVMRAAAKTKRHSFRGQFSKFTTVANPKFGDEFLEEVSASFPNPWQFILSLYCYKIDIPSPSFRSRSIEATTRSLRCL
jgi:phosphoenolpyruvate synthase/pyruvate phosphate dikinase